jgi:hypothetical protein
MKKPFSDTKIGKVLTSPIVKASIKLLPFNIGSAAAEMMEKTDTPVGSMNREKAVHHALKLIIYAVILYLVFSGKIGWDDAEQAKDLITQ